MSACVLLTCVVLTAGTIESTTITEQTITPMTTSIPDNNTTTGASDGSDTSDTSDAGDASDDSDTSDAGDAPSQTTRYMEFAVGGLIAALVCGLLGYLLYHYRTKVGLYCSIVYSVTLY